MNVANLALQQTPPFSVPLRFFLTAPLFGLFACSLLMYYGPPILLNRWNFATLALTHSLTLGVVTMVMMGALLQLLPVLAGITIPKPKWVSMFLHVLLTAGTLSLTLGFMLGHSLYLTTGLLLLSLTFSLFFAIIGYCLVKVVHSHITIAMRLAVLGLFVSVSLGLILLLFLTQYITVFAPAILTNLHLVWGLIGWAALLITGIAYQVVPMFQITPQYPQLITRWLVPALFISLLLFTLSNLTGHFTSITTILLSLELGLFALITLSIQKRRLRKLPDVTLDFWRFGMIHLLLSILFSTSTLIWQPLVTKTFYPSLLGILFIGGFILPVIQGMLYKIVPFLVWLHLQNQQLNILNPIRLVKIPNMKQVILDRQARYQFWVYVSGFILLIAAIWITTLLYISSALLMISFGGLAYNLYKAAWIYYSTSRQLREAKL